MAQYDDLPIGRITAVSLISIAVTIVTVLAVQVVYFGMYNYVSKTKAMTPAVSEAAEVLASQTEAISRFGVNEEDGRLQIPIEEAIKKAVRQAATASNPAEKSEGT